MAPKEQRARTGLQPWRHPQRLRQQCAHGRQVGRQQPLAAMAQCNLPSRTAAVTCAAAAMFRSDGLQQQQKCLAAASFAAAAPSPCRSTSKRTRLVVGYCLMRSSIFFTYLHPHHGAEAHPVLIHVPHAGCRLHAGRPPAVCLHVCALQAGSPPSARLPPKIVVQQLGEVALQLQAEPAATRVRWRAGLSADCKAAAAWQRRRRQAGDSLQRCDGHCRRSPINAVGGPGRPGGCTLSSRRRPPVRSAALERPPRAHSLALLIHGCRLLLRSARGCRAALRCWQVF